MQLLYTLTYTTGFFLSALASPFSKKLRRGLIRRFGLIKRLRAKTANWKRPPYWFHVASSGELEQSLPILEILKQKQPDKPIFISYFSPSAERAITLETQRRKGVVPWDYADYAPFDWFFSVHAAVNVLGPSHYISMYREIWPNLLTEMRRQKIPTFLFSTYFPESSRKLKFFYKDWLSYFDFIGTIDDATTHNLVLLTDSDSIQTLGDPRVARAAARRDRNQAPFKGFFENQKVLVAGSIWPEDFEALKLSLKTLLQHDIRILLAPHQPTKSFIHDLRAWFEAQEAPCRLWSHWSFEPDDKSHLILNEVGHLAEVYQVASMVFVGGSFKARVHNVLEPAVYWKPLLTGPYIENSAEAMALLKGGGLYRCETPEKLQACFQSLLANDLKPIELALQDYINPRLEAPSRYASLLS